MALSTEGKARRISLTEAVFIVNNYVSLNSTVKMIHWLLAGNRRPFCNEFRLANRPADDLHLPDIA